MKQNSIKMYAQALCCALAVCSASNFACGMNIMDVKGEKVKDISAETAISCLQDIDKAASIVWELHNKGGTVSKEDVYAAFKKVGIPHDEVILDPNELTVPPSGTSFVWISECRVSTLAMYLCSRIYMGLPFKNKFTDAVNYEFDQFNKDWDEYSNYEICLACLDAVDGIFSDCAKFLRFYFEMPSEDESSSDLLNKEISRLADSFDVYASYCCDLRLKHRYD